MFFSNLVRASVTGRGRRRLSFWLGTIAVAPVVWLGSVTVLEVPQDLPRDLAVPFDAAGHDFGKVALGERLAHTFHWTNQCSEPVRVTALKTTCGCLAHEVGREAVAPGRSGASSFFKCTPLWMNW